ncbi:MAG: CocE/NonD family hydrolase [Planctomycetota bacterium]
MTDPAQPSLAFPHDVREIEHVTIAVRDGTRLAARLWLPQGAERHPAPAVLEYIPYRKRDGTRLRDEPMHRWFAGHGYAAVRVDVRGTGDSEGVLTDEYTEIEHDDAIAVLEWIAAQPWCSGDVGMIGKSWGGFGALQVAARQPPALRAVIAVCASDDRYADDAHYMGGCLLNENLLWGCLLMTLCAQPPDPQLVGPGWRALWQQRLAAIEPFPARWLGHPLRDDYWRHGSVGEDFGRVQVPVFAVSGWADGYSNAVLRLLAGLSCPRHGLIGPWGHSYPHDGVPGPAIGFLQEALLFLDRWVRGRDNGWERRPLLRAYQQDSARPQPGWPDRAGRWIAEDAWPSPRLRSRAWTLGDGVLVPGTEGDGSAPPPHRSAQTTGLAAGSWCAFGFDGEHPGDQRDDDDASLCCDSAPLDAPLAILGAPELHLELAVDRPMAFVCARLCEVFADGTSARVSYGLHNLNHAPGHDRAARLAPGAPLAFRLQLNDVAHVFAAGSRVRVALSTAYWPIAWPSPAPVQLTLAPGCRLELPERPPSPADDALPPLPPPTAAPQPPFTDLDPGGVHRRIRVDPATGAAVVVTTLDLEEDGSPSRLRFDDIDVETAHGIRETFRIDRGDPLSARGEILHRTSWRSGDVAVRVELRATLTADERAFRFVAELTARDDDGVAAHRRWDESVPRSPAP